VALGTGLEPRSGQGGGQIGGPIVHLHDHAGALAGSGFEARAEGDEVVRLATAAESTGEPADAVRDAVADLGLRLRSILPEHTSLADVFTASQNGPDGSGDGPP